MLKSHLIVGEVCLCSITVILKLLKPSFFSASVWRFWILFIWRKGKTAGKILSLSLFYPSSLEYESLLTVSGRLILRSSGPPIIPPISKSPPSISLVCDLGLPMFLCHYSTSTFFSCTNTVLYVVVDVRHIFIFVLSECMRIFWTFGGRFVHQVLCLQK